jgi:proton-translocating NADH-quinone oxidoreductase chain L
MSEQPMLWLIPGLPLIGAVLAGFLGPKFLRTKSHWPVVLAVAGSFVVTCVYALAPLVGSEHVSRVTAPSMVWFQAGNLSVEWAIAVDPLTATMLTAITFVGTWIAIFSIGYMDGDPGYPRFFAALSLFVTMMCLLVLADNLLLLFAGWEGVGLCSYLLIGFWFQKPSAASAARKGFLVTRIGDAGMLLGIFLLWMHCDYRLDFGSIFTAASRMDPAVLNAACLLLFCGAVGKSAQFPLHVWLPDAMEGPTPASALIHAATMVTAGVYLVARCLPLYVLAPTAQLWVAVIAVITLVLAALIALTQHDLKRVMAYSTVSQLGYMFLALGSARNDIGIAVFGAAAAIFHLFTHAFFKALLFLASGSVMHAMGNVIDMRRFSGLRKVLPITHVTFLCGAAALAGLPVFSGFWSKDEIIGTSLIASHSDRYGSLYFALFMLALIAAGLTAFYTFRAYFRTFWGELKVPPEAGSHGHGSDGHGHDAHAQGVAHESPPVMTIPLMILAVGAVTIGAAFALTHWLAHFLARTPSYEKYLAPLPDEGLNWLLMGVSSIVAFAGAGIAYVMYVARPVAQPTEGSALKLYELSQNRFYLDELYTATVVKPANALAKFCAFFDHILDGLIDLIGMIPSWIGTALRPIQNGLVQFYALAMILGLTVFLVILTLRAG